MMELFNNTGILFPKIVNISHYYLIFIDIIFLLKTYDIICMIYVQGIVSTYKCFLFINEIVIFF